MTIEWISLFSFIFFLQNLSSTRFIIFYFILFFVLYILRELLLRHQAVFLIYDGDHSFLCSWFLLSLSIHFTFLHRSGHLGHPPSTTNTVTITIASFSPTNLIWSLYKSLCSICIYNFLLPLWNLFTKKVTDRKNKSVWKRSSNLIVWLFDNIYYLFFWLKSRIQVGTRSWWTTKSWKLIRHTSPHIFIHFYYSFINQIAINRRWFLLNTISECAWNISVIEWKYIDYRQIEFYKVKIEFMVLIFGSSIHDLFYSSWILLADIVNI